MLFFSNSSFFISIHCYITTPLESTKKNETTKYIYSYILLLVCSDESSTGLIQRSIRDIFQKITLSQAEQATDNNNNKCNNNNTHDSSSADEMSSDNSNSNSNSGGSSSKATFHGSFFEIFNERVYDLLANDGSIFENNSLALRENNTRGVYVEGLKEVQVTNTTEAEALFAKGLSNRHVASTKMNRTSSRSHAVFVLSVKTEHITSDGLRKVRNSKFTLVDLAGSERQKSTGTVLYDMHSICTNL
jgi:hypothetical protein